MIKVADILLEYKISKEDLLKLLKEHTWKEYSEKTSRIWDGTFEKIKSFINTDKSKKKDTVSKKKKETVSNKKKENNKKKLKENKEVNLSNTDKKNKKKTVKKNVVKKKSDDVHKTITSHDVQDMDFLWTMLWVEKKEKKMPKKQELKKSWTKQWEEKLNETKKTSIKIVKRNDIPKKPVKPSSEKTNKFKISKKWDIKSNGKSEKNNEKPIQHKKVEKKAKVSNTLKKKDKIVMWDTISVKELSEKIWVPHTEIIKTFILNWMPVGVNSNVDFDTIALLSDDFWIKVEKENVKSDISAMIEWNLREIVDAKNSISDNLKERSPIVTIMWHVDHGKTRLLDYLRKTDVVGKEAWGITQSIWASQITHNWKKITFIDTPWHELFTAMRARWAKITDIAVIVVAADEWVKQQTVEAINHAKDAWVSIIVAITKIDKANANIDLVKSQVSEHWLMPEEWGGDIPFVALSAFSWEWVDELLEYITLQAEILELKYNPDAPAVWVILEASKTQKNWTVATLLLVTWTLNKKDSVVAYDVAGKIRLMKDWSWKVVKQVKWWDPVQVMWFDDIPESWRIFEVFPSEKEAQKQVWQIKEIVKQQKNKTVLSSLLDRMNAGENVELKVILKAWDFGWLEALKYAVWKVSLPEWVSLKIVHEEVWQVKETDISLAEASWAFIFWFDSWIQSNLKKKLEQKKIIYKNFTIIYELLEYIEQLASWMIEKEVEEVKIWTFKFIALFYKKWNDMIIGWKVLDWVAKNWAHFVVKRWDEELWWWKITSLKIDQDNVSEVKAGRECWLRVRTWARFKEWDILDILIYEK